MSEDLQMATDAKLNGIPSFKFQELKSERINDFIKDWQFISIDNDGTRIYYKELVFENRTGQGFDFCAVSEDGHYYASPEHMEEYWSNPTLDCHIIFEGYAYFDGIRHLHVHSKRNDTNGERNYDGYFYYPDVLLLSEVLIVLKELEKKFCWDI